MFGRPNLNRDLEFVLCKRPLATPQMLKRLTEKSNTYKTLAIPT